MSTRADVRTRATGRRIRLAFLILVCAATFGLVALAMWKGLIAAVGAVCLLMWLALWRSQAAARRERDAGERRLEATRREFEAIVSPLAGAVRTVVEQSGVPDPDVARALDEAARRGLLDGGGTGPAATSEAAR